jgi:hypothetical protein
MSAEEEARDAALPGAEMMADLFAGWAKREGLLGRIDEEQCRDLAKAFMAGYAAAFAWQAETDKIRAALNERNEPR